MNMEKTKFYTAMIKEFWQFLGIYNNNMVQIFYLYSLKFLVCYIVFKYLYKLSLKLPSNRFYWCIAQRVILILRKLSFFLIWVCVMLFLLFVDWGNGSLRIHSEEFDQELWLEEQEAYSECHSSAIQKRGKMVGDLIENYLKFLMTKEEIEKLLGHSTEYRKYGGWYRWSECFEYNIGLVHMVFGGGPDDILLFCNIPKTNWYLYYLTDKNDYGTGIDEEFIKNLASSCLIN